LLLLQIHSFANSIGCDAMPILKNARHERLAQLLASGKNATDAYELAGYKRNGGNGPAMARTPEIKDRVTEINEGRLE
jgi:phage terminase small subunit